MQLRRACAALAAFLGVAGLVITVCEVSASRGFSQYVEFVRNSPVPALALLGGVVVVVGFLLWTYGRQGKETRQKVDLCLWAAGNGCLTFFTVGLFLVAAIGLLHSVELRQAGLRSVPLTLGAWLLTPTGLLVQAALFALFTTCSWLLFTANLRQGRGPS